MTARETFDVSFDGLGELVRRDVIAQRPHYDAPGTRWSFEIIFPKDGEPFARLEVTPPPLAGEVVPPAPASSPPALGAELDLPADIRVTPRQRAQLAGVDREAREGYARNRREGIAHWIAIDIAREDMARRARPRIKRAA